jgi:ATPase subunit of ABC transporter with duplicated ATPase domains
MLQIDQVSMEYRDRVLFDDVTLTLSNKYRYIVVGGNGAGKSTFLSILAGELSPTLGEITTSKSATMGWMRQDQHTYDHLSLADVVIRGNTSLWEALQKKNKLLEQPHFGEKESEKLAKLEEVIAQLNGYRAKADAEALLIGLGIKTHQFQNPLKTLSGGWKMRVLLAQLLFNNPDILLLDEPTNYLDIASIGWLEKYLLNAYKGLLILVSHDQWFLERIGTCVLDVDYGQILSYPGTYKHFLAKKEAIAEQKGKEFAVLEAKVKRVRRFIDRFKSKPTKAGQTASREKMLEKIVWPELGRSSRESPQFAFKQERPSGQIPFKAKGVYKMYEPDVLIGPLNLEVIRGEKLGFVGPNGGGKTTLMKTLSQEIAPDEGEVKWGHKVTLSLFHQEHKHLFKGGETVFDWLGEKAPHIAEQKRRQALGALLFKKEDSEKKVSMLSGGEMARLHIALMMLSGANVLILDEPTNHLDLESKEALASALANFPGTVLFVSHDRIFIETVATRLIYVYRDQVQEVSLSILEENWSSPTLIQDDQNKGHR